MNENATKLFGRRFTGNWNFESINSNRHRVLGARFVDHIRKPNCVWPTSGYVLTYKCTYRIVHRTSRGVSRRHACRSICFHSDAFLGLRIAGSTFAARKQTRDGATRRVEPTKQRMADRTEIARNVRDARIACRHEHYELNFIHGITHTKECRVPPIPQWYGTTKMRLIKCDFGCVLAAGFFVASRVPEFVYLLDEIFITLSRLI